MTSIDLKVQFLHFELDGWVFFILSMHILEVGLPSEADLSVEYYIAACRRSHR